MRIKVKDLRKLPLPFLITAFIAYTFWYQYQFQAIDGMLSVLGILMTLSILPKLLVFSQYRELYGILIFLVLSMFSGAFFSENVSASLHLSMNILEYLLVALAIYSYVGGNLKRFQRLNYVIVGVMTLLACGALFSGIETSTGAVTIGRLNTNVLASLLTMGIVSASLLLIFSKSVMQKVVLSCLIGLNLLAIFRAASRRGVLVAVFFLIFTVFIWLKRKDRHNGLKKIFVLLFLVAFAAVVTMNFNDLIGNTAFFERLMGGKDVAAGDAVRNQLRRIAYDCFTQSPVVGQGLGAVEHLAGVYAHSLYFELLACTGVIGFGIFMAYLLRELMVLYRVYRNVNRHEYPEISLVNSVIAVYILTIFISGYAVVFIYDAYFYVMIALIASWANVAKTYQY